MEPKCHSEGCADVLNDISVDTCDKQSRGFIVELSPASEGRNTKCLPMGKGKGNSVLHTGENLTKERCFQDPFNSSRC